MISQPPGDSDANTQTELLRDLDQVCDRFEADWCAGLNPLIEDYVEGVSEPLRSQLLRELVALEVSYRRKSGQTPVCAEYEKRFTSDTATVREGFGCCSSIESASGQVNTEAPASSDTPSGHLEIRCPSCHAQMQVAVDTSLTELTCRSCGSHFSLVDQSQATQRAPPLTQLGRFELVERLGIGGFGSVWKARDKELDRTVAIKIPRQGSMTAEEQERFFHEARAAAQLCHPNIVSVHEVGRDGESVFIVSDFVSGVTLGDWLTGQQLTGREAAEMCVKIADALDHAHEAGVVHRDLKPANIMIDGDVEPHLMDFGLARRDVGEVTITIDGQVLGTPAYMSPEQAQGEAHQADRRSDVYSLGVILFQLLTGELPFRGNPRMLVHQVIHDEPPSPTKLNRSVARDLETITLKCLEKDPGRRYQTAGAVADELRRFLAGKPIKARPLGRWERGYRLCRRNPLAASLSGALAMSLALGAIVSIYFAHEFRQQRDVAFAAQAKAEIANARSVFEQGNALHLSSRGPESRVAYERAHAKYESLGLSTLPTEIALFRSLRTFAAPINSLKGHSKCIMAVAFAPDGFHAYTASLDGTIGFWDTRTGLRLRTFDGHGRDVLSLAISPDGARIVAGYAKGEVLLWDTETGQSLTVFETRTRVDRATGVRGVAFSPAGELIACSSEDGQVRIWDVAQREQLRMITVETEHRLGSVDISPDAKLALVAVFDGSLRVFDIETGQETARLLGHTGMTHDAVFSPDGGRILSASSDRTARLWDVATGEMIRAFTGHSDAVRGVLFTSDGQRAVTSSVDGTLRLWDVETGKQHDILYGDSLGFRGISLSPDGRRVLAGEFAGTARLWDLEATEVPSIEILSPLVRVSPDGRTFLCADDRGHIALYDISTLSKLRTCGRHESLKTMAFLPGGESFLTSHPTTIRDLRSGEVLRAYPERNTLLVSADGRLALTAKSQIWNTDTGETLHSLPLDLGDAPCFQFSPGGTHLLVGQQSGKLSYWDLQSMPCRFDIITQSGDDVRDVAFSDDGARALSGRYMMLRLWDLKTARPIREFKGVTASNGNVCFSSDGRSVYATDQTMLRVWDLASAEQLELDASHPFGISSLAKVPGTDILLTVTAQSIHAWDFSRPVRYLDFAERLRNAKQASSTDPNNASYLHTLGEWYAFRGVYDWAIDMLEQAREGGEDVSSLLLARCYWQLGQNAEAAREFRLAIEKEEAPLNYLNLCLDAVSENVQE